MNHDIKFQFYVQQVDGGFAIFQSSWRGEQFLRKRQHSQVYTTAKAADRRCSSLIGQAAERRELKHG
jgi:hypothetical protein